MSSSGDLQRRSGVGDAVVIGAGSMIGAGVFAAWSPVADAAGTGLLVGLLIAGVVAFCNAAPQRDRHLRRCRLTYYAITNAAALTWRKGQRRWPASSPSPA